MVDLGYNYLLDELPKAYMGYKIRTNFTVGLKIFNIFDNNKLSIYLKYEVAIKLLFEEIPSNISTAIQGLNWFMNCGRADFASDDKEYDKEYDREDDTGINMDINDDTSEARAYDFNIDNKEIYTAFRRTYKVDLHKDYVHWFDFIAMLSDLEECNFTRIVEIRTKSLKDLSDAEKRYYSNQKQKYRLPPTDDEIQIAKDIYGSRLIHGVPAWKTQWLGCWFYDSLE